ncbi:hypothetical protein KCP73_06235 [Salmonella enterica subsp. enterica]|nr:hypothetical protein KCP73_06235 [Salmonella enterica subsp. enterica]
MFAARWNKDYPAIVKIPLSRQRIISRQGVDQTPAKSARNIELRHRPVPPSPAPSCKAGLSLNKAHLWRQRVAQG